MVDADRQVIEDIRDRFTAGNADRATVHVGELRDALNAAPRLTITDYIALRRPGARPSATCPGDGDPSHHHDAGCLA